MYYRILHSSDQSQIGYGADEIRIHSQKVSQKRFSTFHDIPREGKLPVWINLPPLEMHDNALKVDLLRVGQFGGRILVMSERAKTIINYLKEDNTQWVPIEIWHLKQKNTYFAAYLPINRQEFIDWKRSTFSLVYTNKHDYSNGTLTPLEIKELELSNYSKYLEHMRSLMGKPQTIRAKQLNLITQIPFDIFKMSSPAFGVYVSERLKKEIEKEELTGFAFKGI